MTDRTERIRRIVQEQGRIAHDLAGVGDAANLYDVGLTSHATVNVMLALESEFDVEFPEEHLTRTTFETIANLRAAIGSMLGEDHLR